MADFVMPILGADMTAGTLVEWHKQPGDRVKRGDIIAEVETEKGLIEVEIFVDGVVEHLLVKPGTQVPVGTVLAQIREEGAPPTAEMELVSVHPGAAGPTLPPAGVTVQPPVLPPIQVEGRRLRISPAARKLAAELGIDPASVRGTGPDAAVTREDIERAAAQRAARPAAPAAPAAAVDRWTRLRQTIAAAMTRSKREIPHYYLSTTIDMQRTMTWVNAVNAQRPVTERLIHGVLFIKAVALALRELPELNAWCVDGRVVQKTAIHVGVAIALRQGGLVAPALHDADRQSVDELMRNFRDLVQRARAGSLRSSELSDPTITVTSIGEQGVDSVFAIIYPPQAAIVGFGKIVERPWSVDGQIVSRPLVTATLSGDHRVTDGHRGALFLSAVDRLLQEPARL